MSEDVSFNRADYDLTVSPCDSIETGVLEDCKQAVRRGWMAKTRRKIERITGAPEMAGDVVAIHFEDATLPTLGGYTDGLLAGGWGYLSVDGNVLYVAPIEATGDGYRFSGRDEVGVEVPAIRSVPDIQSADVEDMRGQRRLERLCDDIAEAWPVETLARIREVKPSTSKTDSYIIKFSSTEEEPHVPLGDCIDEMLARGWGVAGIKGTSLFVARLTEDGDGFVFRGGKSPCYQPEPCERCGANEYEVMLVVGEKEGPFGDRMMPEYERFCSSCHDEVGHPTAKEYRENDEEELSLAD